MQLTSSDGPVTESAGRSDRRSTGEAGQERVRLSVLPNVWVLQTAALAAAVVWVSVDPALEWLIVRSQAGVTQPITLISDAAGQLGWQRAVLMLLLVFVATGSMAGWLVAWLRRPPSGRAVLGMSISRSLKSLLVMTTFCAGWFGLAANASSLAWQGKRVRLAWSVEQLEPLAECLRRQWPQHDSQLPGIGPFNAYPFGRPQVLLLMQPPSLNGDSLHLSAVERGPSGSIKFQLGDAVRDDWAEWHPETSRPQSFVGGLQDEHRLQTYASLGKGWYLVRYEG